MDSHDDVRLDRDTAGGCNLRVWLRLDGPLRRRRAGGTIPVRVAVRLVVVRAIHLCHLHDRHASTTAALAGFLFTAVVVARVRARAEVAAAAAFAALVDEGAEEEADDGGAGGD